MNGEQGSQCPGNGGHSLFFSHFLAFLNAFCAFSESPYWRQAEQLSFSGNKKALQMPRDKTQPVSVLEEETLHSRKIISRKGKQLLPEECEIAKTSICELSLCVFILFIFYLKG